MYPPRTILRNLAAVLLAVLAGPQLWAQSVESFQSIRLFHPSAPTQGITLTPPSGITSYTLTFPTTAPTAGTALVSTGNGGTAWSAVPTIGSALNSNRILISNAGSISEASALTNGQILIGSTGQAPVAATLTAGTGISVTSAAGSITISATGALPAGTTNNATLRYNTATSAWVENTNALSATDGSVTLGGALGSGTSTATPVTIGMGSSYASDLNPLKAKLILYNDLSNNTIGMGVSLSSFNFFVNSASQFSWRSGSGATPTEIMSLTSSRLTLPSTTDLTIKGVSYTWPTANGAAGTVLTNNGSGTLTWSVPSSSGWSLTGNAGTNATNNYIGTTDNVDFVIRTFGSERMRVLAGGNVGVGISVPTTRLHVVDAATAAAAGQAVLALTGQMVAGTVGSGPMISFREVSTGNAAATIRAYTFGASSTGLAFSTGWNGPTDRMFINNAGNVGIGTNDPQRTLHVSGTMQARVAEASAQQSNLRVLSTASTSGVDVNWRGRAVFGAENLTALLGVFRNQAIVGAHSWASANSETSAAWADLYLNWDAGAGGGGGNVLAKGSVGIGTTTPSQLLTVMNGNIYLDNGGTASELRFREPSASGANYTAFRAGAQAADLTYTLPLTAPTAGQILSSDASGNLSWTSTAASGWGLTGNAGTNATNNYIGTTDNVDFVVRTFGTERMRVLGGGNVTLGGALGTGTSTATPVTLSLGSTFASSVTASQAKLRIFENSSGADIYGLGVSSSQLNYFVPTGATHRWYVNNVETMWLSSTLLAVPSSNMAIGTSSSTERLTVSGNIALTGSINLAGTAGAPGTPSVLAQQTTSGANTWIYRESGFPAWGVYHYNTDDASAVQNSWMFMNGNSVGWSNTSFTSIPAGSAASIVLQNQTGNAYFAGNIGINTTAPTARLHVTGGNIFLDNAGTAGELRFREPSGSGANYTAFRAGAQAADLTYTLPLSAPTAGQILSSDASGNLSWTSPAGAPWLLTGNGGTNASTNYIGTTDAVDFVIRTAALERMRVLAGGNVTIGGALGGGTPTAAPVTLTLGSTFADAPTSNKAKLRIFEASIAGYVYGFGVSDSRLNYFVPSGATHRWYIGDVLTKTLDNTGFMTLVGSTPGIGTDAATDLLLRTNSAERIRIASGGNVTIGGALGGGTSTATPVTLTLGSTFADAPTSNKAKLRIFESSSAGSVYGLGVSGSQFNYFSPSGATHRWYINDAEMMSLSATAATKLTVTNGNIYLDNTGTAGELRFREPSASGANYTAFRAGAQAADLTYTLPLTAPTAGQILSSDASGNLSWANAASAAWGLAGSATDQSPSGWTPISTAFSGYNGTEWIGTNNLTRLMFGTNGINRGFIETTGGWTLDALTLSSISGAAGSAIGTNDRILIATSTGAIGQISFGAFAAATNSSWSLTGNITDQSPSGWTPISTAFSSYNGTEWIGTSNATRLMFGTNGVNRGFIETSGGWTLDALTVSALAGSAGSAIGSNDRILIATSTGAIGQISFGAFAAATNSSWSLTGNTTDDSPNGPTPTDALFSSYPGTEYMGTSNATRLYFGTGGRRRGFIESGGGWTLDGTVSLTSLSGTAGSAIGTNDRILIATNGGAIGQISFAAFAAATNSGWSLTGNTTDASPSGPTPLGSAFTAYAGTEYIGTSNLTRLYFGTNGINRGFIEQSGGWSLDGAITLSTVAGAAGTTAGSNDRVLIATNGGAIGQISFAAFAAATNSGWSLTGNTTDASPSGPTPLGTAFTTYAGTEYIGTSNATRLYFGTSGVNRGFIESTGGWNLQGPFMLNDQARFAAGTAAAPSVSRDGDTDNGMFFPVANALAFSTGGTERVRLTDAGRVGIGNAAPAYVLDVTGDINSSTNVRAAGTALTSDKRLKRNIVEIDSATDLISRLVPVKYEKKSTIPDSVYRWKQMGFIAQDLQKILPDLVHMGADADSTLSVDYNSLIPLLTKAIQEQQSTITQQQQKIQQQDAILRSMEERLRALEQKR